MTKTAEVGKTEVPVYTHRAKLTRGNIYIYDGKTFRKDVEVPVTEDVATALKELKHTSRDSRSGDVIERGWFRISEISADEEGDEDTHRPARKVTKRPSRSASAK